MTDGTSKMREALEFYANSWDRDMMGDPEEPHLTQSFMIPSRVLIEDEGERARQALSSPPQSAGVNTQDKISDAESFLNRVEDTLARRFPRCRDCADHDGRCPNTGLPCDLRSAFANVLKLIVPQSAGGSVPEGWQLVPKEATREMISIGNDAIDDNLEHWGSDSMGEWTTPVADAALNIYRAMLSASPPPPAQNMDHAGGEPAGSSGRWQPIETAPKDGSRILLYWPATAYNLDQEASECLSIGSWKENSRLRSGQETHNDELLAPAYFSANDELDDYGMSLARHAPTHWMPLPAPPSGLADGEMR